MGKLNPEYLRQSELCRKMAEKAKLPDLKLAWQDLAARWLELAQSRLRSRELKAAARSTNPALHLKKFAGF